MNLDRITIITSEFLPQPGGIGNHAFNLAQGLADHKYTVTVLADRRSRTGEEERRFDVTLDFEVIRIPRMKIILLTYFHRIIKALLLRRRSEVIIVSGKFPLWLGGFLSFSNKKKYIAVVHGSELLLPHKVLRKLTDLSLSYFDKIVAVSNFTKSLLQPSISKNVCVIHNGFRLECSTIEKSKVEGGPVLITIGNVTERKGQQNVIKALPLLLKKYPDLKYYIVGIPTEKENLQNLARELKVEAAIIFCGAVNETEKCALLRKADIFLMLSENTSQGDVEGFGIALLEGNSLGIPSIGSKGCGIEEAVKNGYSGLLVDKRNPKEIFAAVEHILGNYQSFSTNASAWAGGFHWEQVINRYIDLIEE